MASTPKPPSSFFTYRDDSHLSWQAFRENVLSPRRIHLHDPSPDTVLPSDLSLKIQTSLENVDRFDEQRSEFRIQVDTGRGFSDSPIWPPNCLPPFAEDAFVQRATSPKLSREALPLRAPGERGNLMEISTPRPALACGFTSEAFTEIELSNLPSPLTTSGTIVHFEKGHVAPGVALHCPFFAFERVRGLAEDTLESAKNQSALSGSVCVRALQILYFRAFGRNGGEKKPVAFSCIMDNSFAIINYHSLDNVEEYNMTPLCKFDFTKDDHFNKFQAWIEAIEDWALTQLLPMVKAAARKLASSNDTPPISPMPSLSLSVDTSTGGDETLMKALRSAFSSIKWRYRGIGETPIMSSIAQCGTPLMARRMRSLALSPLLSPMPPESPLEGTAFKSMRIKIPMVAVSKAAWSDIFSPASRRFDLSPLQMSSPLPDSPARPGTLSPCSPPIDAPFAPMNPMLVVQRRLDHALDEIRELKLQLDHVNHELRAKTETPLPIDPAVLEALKQLAKRVDLIEREAVSSKIPMLHSLASSLKHLAAQTRNAIEPRYLGAAASVVLVASIVMVGQLLGFKFFESLACVPPAINLVRPRRLRSLWRSASLWMPSLWFAS